MNIVLRIFSSKIVWVFFSSLLLFDLHYELSEFSLETPMKITLFGLLTTPIDLTQLAYYPEILVIFKIISFLGFLAINDMIYEAFLKNIKKKNLLDIDPEEYEVKSVPIEIENLLNPKNIPAQNNEQNSIKEDNLSINQENLSNKQKNLNIKQNNLSINDKKFGSVDGYLKDLQELIGLDTVKKEINSILNFIRVNQMRMQKGIVTYNLSYHMVFTGNPGTGKTTVARILANIFRELGIISVGHLVEVDRSGLVAGYMGQTALKVKDVLDTARGGVLFIDEAYSLVGESTQNDYGKEAIETLLKYMEDYRGDLIVIVAGYNEPMRTFIHTNPGLKSRFNRFINFEDYNPVELLEILKSMSTKANYIYSENAIMYLEKFFIKISQTNREHYGNGRGVRNLFEKIITVHANRMADLIVPSDEALSIIVEEDILLAIKEISRSSM